MALSGRTSQRPRGRAIRRLTLGIMFLFALALLVAQSAPQISQFFVPVRTTVSDRISAPAETGLWARMSGQAARDRRIRELENEVRDLARYKEAAISMADRLESYEDMLNLLGEPPEKGVTARVTAETNGPFAQTVLANAGRLQGVEPGGIAVNEGGLVGRVIHLGQRSSRILLLSDYNSRLPVVGEVSGVRAILYGDNNEEIGKLGDLPEDSAFIERERILTSGDGGLFPRGLVVGEVRRNGDDWRVRFSMRERRGGYVRIVAPMPIEAPPVSPDLEALPAVEGEVVNGSAVTAAAGPGQGAR